MTQLDPVAEQQFQKWYATIAYQYRLDPNPDDPRHFYDWRGAFQSGAQPDYRTGHWPSQFKEEGHPNRYVPIDTGGYWDTKENQSVVAPPAWWRALQQLQGKSE